MAGTGGRQEDGAAPTSAEPVDDAGDAEPIDEIDVGGTALPPRLARLLQMPTVRGPARWAARFAAAVLALFAVVALADGAARRWAVLDGMGSAADAPSSAGTPTPFDRVFALAHQQRLHGNIRQASAPGECATVQPGSSPERAVLDVVHGFLPGAVLIDSARTLDQFTGLCSLQLRANAPGAVRVVVEISSPPAHPAPNTLDAVEVGLENPGPETVEYVREAMHTGWEILIGAVGDVSALPRTMDLTAAAELPQLQW